MIRTMMAAGAIALAMTGCTRARIDPKDWAPITNSSDDDLVFLKLDLNNRLWLRYEFKETQQPFGYLSDVDFFRYDCDDRSLLLLQRTVYKAHNMLGHSLSMPGDSEPRYNVPGSVGDDVVKIACRVDR